MGHIPSILVTISVALVTFGATKKYNFDLENIAEDIIIYVGIAGTVLSIAFAFVKSKDWIPPMMEETRLKYRLISTAIWASVILVLGMSGGLLWAIANYSVGTFLPFVWMVVICLIPAVLLFVTFAIISKTETDDSNTSDEHIAED